MTHVGPHAQDLGTVSSGSNAITEVRTDENGCTTFHVHSRNDKTGIETERIYDSKHQLTNVIKKSPTSRSETYIDAQSGVTKRVYEVSVLPDGNHLTKHVVYPGADVSSESVLVTSHDGRTVRKIERQYVGSRTTFQGQTEFNADGQPTTTTNHYKDIAKGYLTRREQIQWAGAKNRALTENFYFSPTGDLTKYIRLFFHPNGSPFLEETQEYHDHVRALKYRQVVTYALDGRQTCVDALKLNEQGEIIEKTSTFFDMKGQGYTFQNAKISPDEHPDVEST